MKKNQEKIDAYNAIEPAKFDTLKSLTLNHYLDSSGALALELTVTLGDPFSAKTECLYLIFFGVLELKFEQPSFSVITLELQILAGDELPMVGSEFYVRDPEQDEILHFECADFEFAITTI